MSTHVPASDARIRRVAAEEETKKRFELLVRGAGVSISEAAENYLGIARNDLYECFGGDRHPRLAWLELLPAEAEVAHLRTRAKVHGFDLAAVTEDHASLAEVCGEAGRVLSALALSESDGHISPAEAHTDIAAIEQLERALAKAKALRVSAIAVRGIRLPRVG